jgi:hypothetical protein
VGYSQAGQRPRFQQLLDVSGCSDSLDSKVCAMAPAALGPLNVARCRHLPRWGKQVLACLRLMALPAGGTCRKVSRNIAVMLTTAPTKVQRGKGICLACMARRLLLAAWWYNTSVCGYLFMWWLADLWLDRWISSNTPAAAV